MEGGEREMVGVGRRLDGHDFVAVALERGAAAAVVRKDQLERYAGKAQLLVVDDTLVALQRLATAVRKLTSPPENTAR